MESMHQYLRKAKAGRRAKGRIQAMVDAHFADPSKRDGRGRKAVELRKAKRTFWHLTCATRWRHRDDLDVNVRQEAKALVRTALHAQVPFEEVMERAKALRGRVNKSGKVRNDRRAIAGCEPLRIDLPRVFRWSGCTP